MREGKVKEVELREDEVVGLLGAEAGAVKQNTVGRAKLVISQRLPRTDERPLVEELDEEAKQSLGKGAPTKGALEGRGWRPDRCHKLTEEVALSSLSCAHAGHPRDLGDGGPGRLPSGMV